MKIQVFFGSLLFSCLAINNLLDAKGGRGGSQSSRQTKKIVATAAPTISSAAMPATTTAAAVTVSVPPSKSATNTSATTSMQALFDQAEKLSKAILASQPKDFFVPGVDENLLRLRELLENISKDPGYQDWLKTSKEVFKAACEKAWPATQFVTTSKSLLFFTTKTDKRPKFVQALWQ